ncbi:MULTISPECIES: arabinan endo-1,5-alpha-L-arabinosidase [unclassified Exiguobacterium]|uniref:arabinan endo-1,5-alpha-L-arabinosidase n=1 Tax=unclassified Exiguobacterium TaxID=2644629 RepID=UPI001BECC008|nr:MULTISPECIES: arabinan endo-1,5-alpha-L-arabinosidase [unclassified Exiguobacterium]
MKKILIGIIVLFIAGCSFFWWSTRASLQDLNLPKAPFDKKMADVRQNILNQEKKWTTNFTHDGAIIKEGDTYYVFSTDYMVGGPPTPGIQVRKSKDLINWEFTGRVFDEVSQEAFNWTGGNTFWAPSITKIKDTFYLYYSVSKVGSRTSYIGMASASNVEGPWRDQGVVIASKEGDGKTVNAIDPHVLQDKTGKWWMTYGSYFGGIFLTEINPNTGKLMKKSSEGKLLAKRKDMTMGIEGPEILYNAKTGYYYLMVSYGWLEDSYNVRIGRSKSLDGPYVDSRGRDLRDTSDESFDTGLKIVGSYRFGGDDGYVGTGHSAFLQDGEDTFIIHQARPSEDIYWSQLQVRKVYWTKEGWPVVSPERYAGEKNISVQKDQIVGEWEIIIFPRFDDGQQQSRKLKLQKEGTLLDEEGSWQLKGDILSLRIGQERYELRVGAAWDWENWKSTIIMTGLSEDGTAVWTKKR